MFQVISFFIYWLKKVDEHSLQSPFLYSLYTRVILKRGIADVEIEAIRNQLLQNDKLIQIMDYGAGSRVTTKSERSIKSIAKHASTPLNFSVFLAELIDYFQFSNVLELGTSLGINTLYLSQNSNVNVLTLEGDPNIASIAEDNFSTLNRRNIKTIIGNIDQTLGFALEDSEKLDLVYIDANHRFEPTLRYFDQIIQKCHQQTVIVIDDIHWSKEMAMAWKTIISRSEVTLSIDLFEAGLIWLDPKFSKEDYVLNF